jgi:hypothetical protein
MTDIHFMVEESPEGGYAARALEASIFTETDDLDGLRNQIRDAVLCHFDEGETSRLIHLHFTRDEVIAA